MAALWRYFDEGNVNVQKLIAHAVDVSRNPTRARECLARLESVQDSAVREQLEDAMSRMLYHLLTGSDVDSARKDEALRVASNLKEKGLARDFLVKQMTAAKP
jgi:hypothetical protein